MWRPEPRIISRYCSNLPIDDPESLRPGHSPFFVIGFAGSLAGTSSRAGLEAALSGVEEFFFVTLPD